MLRINPVITAVATLLIALNLAILVALSVIGRRTVMEGAIP
jgi:hypothetical protein